MTSELYNLSDPEIAMVILRKKASMSSKKCAIFRVSPGGPEYMEAISLLAKMIRVSEVALALLLTKCIESEDFLPSTEEKDIALKLIDRYILADRSSSIGQRKRVIGTAAAGLGFENRTDRFIFAHFIIRRIRFAEDESMRRWLEE